jgi:lactoylglutathione lyase
VTLEIVLLAIPGSDVQLEILEYRGVKREPVDTATANPGTAHFSLVVEGLDRLHATLSAKGVEFVSDVQTRPGVRTRAAGSST